MTAPGRRALAFGVALALSAAALSAWFATHTRPMTDEGAVLTAAAKLLRGGVFYRDVDAYWFPGSAQLAAFAMRIFGEDLSVARALAGLSYLTTVLSLYALAVRMLSFRRAAWFGLGLLALKVFAWPAWTAYFYWDLATAAACAAILALLGPAGGPRVVLAGAFVGLAYLFKQNVGLYLAAMTGLLLLVGRGLPGSPAERAPLRDLARLCAGIAIPVAPSLAYFTTHGLLDELLFATFVRPWVGYLPTGGVSFWEPLAWWRLGSFDGLLASYFPMPYFLLLQQAQRAGAPLGPGYWLAGELFTRLLYTSVAAAVLATAALAWRRRGARLGERDHRFLAFAALALAVLASAFPRADFPHVIAVYPLVLLVLAWLWERAAGRLAGRAGRALGALEWTTAVAVVLLAGGLAVVHQAQRSHRLELPRARVWVPPEHAYLETVVQHVTREVPAGEPFFVYGNEAHLYFLSGRYFPWRFSQLYPGQEGGDQGAALAELLRRESPAVVVRGWTARLAMLPAIPSYAPRLEAQVRSQYAADQGFLRRNPPPTGIVPPVKEFALLRPRRP